MLNPAVKYNYSYPEEVHLRSYNPTLQGHKGQIKKALKAIQIAKRPVLFIGGGVITSNCAEVTQFAHNLNLPVTASLMGLGGFREMINNSLVCLVCTAPMKPITPCIRVI